MHELVIRGRFLTSEGVFWRSLGIDRGGITEISKGELPGERVIAPQKEALILPGLIDTHVHLRDFLQKEKETVESGTKAAVHGGITAVFDMPNTNPPVMDKRTFERRLELLKKHSHSDYAVGFLVAGNCGEAASVDADFYKIFMGSSTGGIFSEDFEADYSCAPGPVSVHAEDAEIIRDNPKRPPQAEITAIKRAVEVAKKIRKRLNICHVSTGEGLEEILQAKLPWVSFEATPHHLLLTRRDYERNPYLKVYPPLRGNEDRMALWRHFKEIPIIASDHAPHTPEDKENGAAGIPGLETEVALLLDGASRGLLEYTDIVEKMHDNPIRAFGINGRNFEVGGEATFTVVDPKMEWVVKPEEFYTKAKWSPWEGKKLRGKVVMTIIRGEIVMEEDEVLEKPGGVRLNVNGNEDKRSL
ncbi:dihydroorotase [Thermococcus sp. Bubb.Bath]|uniref:dihydroorotase n=1 Tax=Thermococcus sp. Bubb.Bath TaxID=1638242 RepID=UPI00143AF555|nr:dihydroorotase [Thermococcus sp. Bubb.Bath]NJF25691.1 dihydroorotase [Thermococcus sp. Bubb.Bath]